MFNYIIKFKIDDIHIEYCYQIRGSLITIVKNKEILTFVDQTIQYSGILFHPHDMSINCSKKILEHLLRDIKTKLKDLKELKDLKDEKNIQNKKD